MFNSLAQLHIETYNTLAHEYEARVETYKAVTTKALQPFIQALPGQARVLDIGCAVGYVVEILQGFNIKAEGIDISPNMIAYARKRLPNTKFVVGDFLAQNPPYQNLDGVILYAFIHLFPKTIVNECMKVVINSLKPDGYIFIGTTKSQTSSEGFEFKKDYENSNLQRFRKHWTNQEIETMFQAHNLKIIHYEDNIDEFGKVWMDYVLQKK